MTIPAPEQVTRRGAGELPTSSAPIGIEMMSVSAIDCDVCGFRPALGVASSTLGPISLAYCVTCNQHGAEPKWLIDATIESCGGVDALAAWVLDGVTIFDDGEYRTVRDAQPPVGESAQ